MKKNTILSKRNLILLILLVFLIMSTAIAVILMIQERKNPTLREEITAIENAVEYV